jgi:spermidine/putrescine transport system substrate-binding protein
METARRSDRYSLSRRSILAGALGVAGTAALAACSSAGTASSSAKKPTIEPKADGNLNWFSWSGYVDPTIVSDFEKKYGVTVTISTFDSNDAMIEKLAAGLPYDLITDNSAYMYESIQGGLVRPFDLKALPEYSQLDPYFRKPSYDGGTLQYSVPYSGGGTGILWRTDKVESMTQSWNDLWNHPEAKGHIFVLDYEQDAIGAGLLHEGYNLNSGVAAQVNSATNALIQLKPELGGISSDTLTNVGNGNAWIAQSWVPDAISVMTKSNYADKLQFEFTPKQGIPFGMDVLSIGANAASPGTAMLFINWMLSPEMSARNAAYTGQASGTIAGDAAFQQVVKDFPAFANGVPYDKALWRLSATGARQTLWTQQWNRFVA